MNLRIPGPTPCPDYVLQAMTRDMINHRGPEFRAMLLRITDRLKQIFQTQNEVLILTASGTGAMEASIVNFFSPGDVVLAVSIGEFGERISEIAEIYGCSVARLAFPMGTAADPEAIRKALEDNPAIKAVLITHNETSTGITNDMAAISKVVKEFDKLLVVDGVSSISSIPFHTDEWGVDVAMSGSQKGYMIPPGLAFVSVSQRAWDAYKEAKIPRFYFDLGRARNYLERGQTPWTPAVSVFYALDVALEKMMEEGMETVYERHARIAEKTRTGVKALGLTLLADERWASNTVTAFKIPEGVDPGDLLRQLQSDHEVVLASGQGSLAGKILRVGHLGYIRDEDINGVMEALASVLPKVGFQPIGSPARSA
ncbi:MAG: alanine--glyoxylate aminotransferase family protein [Chloroflexi bacterium]|nr:alanine--glyoxylate aminotransferase family protein [Chloroflexota bacterium]